MLNKITTMNKKKVIGIVISKQSVYDGVSKSYIQYAGIGDAYVRYFKQFGSVVFIDATSDAILNLDLLVLTGGADVLPTRYTDEPPHWNQQGPNLQLDWFDTHILPQYINNGTPIFGICRGFQTLNVHFGGKLVQDYPFPRSVKSRGEMVEKMVIANDGFIKLKATAIDINSLHHQGIFEEHLGNDLIVFGISKEGKNVEAFYHKNYPIFAVQYHPEEIHDFISGMAIQKLLGN